MIAVYADVSVAQASPGSVQVLALWPTASDTVQG